MNTFPDWYWKKGLHDAQILYTEELQLPYDYINRVSECTAFRFYINSRKAIFENKIKSITLYNYKIFSESYDLKNVYWLSDILTKQSSGYVLEILFYSLEDRDEFTFMISFETAEIET